MPAITKQEPGEFSVVWLKDRRIGVRFLQRQDIPVLCRVQLGSSHLFGILVPNVSLMSTTEELLERNSSGSGLESRDYDRGDPLRWPCDNIIPPNLALTSQRISGSSVPDYSLVEFSNSFSTIYISFAVVGRPGRSSSSADTGPALKRECY
jgi:hypothetical protein